MKSKFERSKPHENRRRIDALKEEVEALNKKLAELTAEELEQVAGGFQTDPGKVSTCPFDTLK